MTFRAKQTYRPRGVDKAGQVPKPNILPSVMKGVQTGVGAAKLKKELTLDKIERSGILSDEDFVYQYNMPSEISESGTVTEIPEFNEIFQHKDYKGPGWFKSAGEMVEVNPSAIGSDIPTYITEKYPDIKGTWDEENIRKVLHHKEIDTDFANQILEGTNWTEGASFEGDASSIVGDTADSSKNITNIVKEKVKKDWIPEGEKWTEAFDEAFPKGEGKWAETIDPPSSYQFGEGMSPFFTKPTSSAGADILLNKGGVIGKRMIGQGADITMGGPLKQTFNALTTLGRGKEAGLGLKGLFGAGQQGAGLFAGMTPFGWTMMALSLLGGLKKHFK